MRAIAQFTIVNLNDVVSSDTPPENPYIGQLWVNIGTDPPETLVWDGLGWQIQNDLDDLRSTMETTITKFAELQQSMDGLNSYVSVLTETVETIGGDVDEGQARVLEMENKVSALNHSVDGLSVKMEQQYSGGINFIKNSAGLNGITDDWETSGTVSVIADTDVKNNTASDSAFLLGEYSSLTQTITGVVTGTSYAFSIRAKKVDSNYLSYFSVQYNGNKKAYLFEKASAFDWTDYSAVIDGIQDGTVTIYIYSRAAELYISDIMMVSGSIIHRWTPAPNEIYSSEVKVDRRGIVVSNSASSQRTIISNEEFSGYYNDEKIFTLNKDETQTKKTTVDGELTVGKTKFVPMSTASNGLNIVILD